MGIDYKSNLNKIFRYLDTDGDGTGTKDSAVDHSSSQGKYFITPQSETEILEIHRGIVHVADGSIFSAEKYGGIAALTNGIRIVILDADDDIICDLTDGLPIKSNGEWGRVCFDAVPSNYGQGDEYLNVRWTFSKSGSPITLAYGEKLAMLIDDDLSDLLSHTIQVQGQRGTI